VGKVEEKNVKALYTHRDFIVKYNGDRIISVDVNQKNLVPLTTEDSLHIDFTYSVEWAPTTEPYSSRQRNSVSFFEHKIHWFSIFNSFMIVIALIGVVFVILLRTLKRDLARYDREEFLLDGEKDFIDEYGWKQIHGDVFRAPMHLTMLASLLGTGLHLFVIALGVLLYAVSADFQVQSVSVAAVAYRHQSN
jgi:transmembrane 9 superfamily protein 3